MTTYQLRHLYCGFSLRTGSKITAWFSLITNSLLLIAMVTAELFYPNSEYHPLNDPEINNYGNYMLLLILLLAVSIVLGILLLVGIYQERPNFILPWLIVQFTVSSIDVLRITCDIISYQHIHAEHLKACVFAAACFYFQALIYLYYRTLKRSTKDELTTLQCNS